MNGLPTVSSDDEHFAPTFKPPAPPAFHAGTMTFGNNNYADEEDDDDDEFAVEHLAASRKPSQVDRSEHPLNKMLMAQQLKGPQGTPQKTATGPPPPINTYVASSNDSAPPPPPPQDYEDDRFDPVSQVMDWDESELERIQQQRKNTTTPNAGAFRSNVRPSFSGPPGGGTGANGKSALLNNINNADFSVLSSSAAPIAKGESSYQKPTIYGVTMPDGSFTQFKYPIDNNVYVAMKTHGTGKDQQEFQVTDDGIPRSPFLDYKTPVAPKGTPPTELLTFQGTLTSVEEALRQAKSGQYAVKRVYKFIDQWCNGELKHIDHQVLLLITEAYKLGHSAVGPQLTPEQLQTIKTQFRKDAGIVNPRSEQYDMMAETQHKIVAVYNALLKEITIKRQRIASCRRLILELHTVADLLEHKIKKCADDYKMFCSEKAKELGYVRKLEKECLTLLKQARQVLGLDKEEEEAKAAKATEAKSRSKAWSLIKGVADKAMVSVAGGPQQFCQELAVKAEAYNAAIIRGNEVIATHHTRCQKLFGQLALIEAERIVVLNHTVSKFATHGYLAQIPILQLFNDLLYQTFEMDPQYEFQEYLRKHRHVFGLPSQEQPEVYRLPASPDDIRQMKLDVNPNSVFRVSLQQCMNIQKKDHPNLAVPRIVNVLITAVKQLKGVEHEGIFRISHQQDELKALRKQFESGNYDIPPYINSPHAPAALFKEWLRELQDSLIPTDKYNDWMNVAKTVTAPGMSQAQPTVDKNNQSHQNGLPSPTAQKTPSQEAFSSDPKSEQDVLQLFETLDPISKAVIIEIAVLCVEIAHPLNRRVNRMTIENLAIVFAPSFFRNPSDDPNEIMMNSKNEVKMCSLLLGVVGMKNKDLSDMDREFKATSNNVPQTPTLSGPMPSIPMTPLASSVSAGGGANAHGSGHSGMSFFSSPQQPRESSMPPAHHGSASMFSSPSTSFQASQQQQQQQHHHHHAPPHPHPSPGGPGPSLFTQPIPENGPAPPPFGGAPTAPTPPPLNPQQLQSHFSSGNNNNNNHNINQSSGSFIPPPLPQQGSSMSLGGAPPPIPARRGTTVQRPDQMWRPQ